MLCGHVPPPGQWLVNLGGRIYTYWRFVAGVVLVSPSSLETLVEVSVALTRTEPLIFYY